MSKIILFLVLIITLNSGAQNQSIVQKATGNWSSLIKLNGFDPNDDQQSNADTDFVGNATYALMETQKQTVTFTDGITDEVYYFRARMGQSNPNTSFYFGIDVSGDLIADVFIEANVKAQTPFVSFHVRDYSKTGISPSQTAWLNGTQNNELFLTNRDAFILDSGTQVYEARVHNASTTTGAIRGMNASGTYVTQQVLSSTVPMTWTTDDEIGFTLWYEGV